MQLMKWIQKGWDALQSWEASLKWASASVLESASQPLRDVGHPMIGFSSTGLASTWAWVSLGNPLASHFTGRSEPSFERREAWGCGLEAWACYTLMTAPWRSEPVPKRPELACERPEPTPKISEKTFKRTGPASAWGDGRMYGWMRSRTDSSCVPFTLFQPKIDTYA